MQMPQDRAAMTSITVHPRERDRPAPRPGLVSLLLAAGTLLVAVATIVGFAVQRDSDESALQARVYVDASDAADTLQRLTTAAGVAPAAIAGLFIGVGQTVVSDEIFAGFTAPLLDTEAMSALEWVPRVAAADAVAYEASRRGAYPGFILRQVNADGTFSPVSGRPAFYPVAFVQPFEGNSPALGLDLGSEATRATALMTARDTGALAATAPIHLAQGGTGMLVFYPAYASGLRHQTATERQAALVGFGLAVLRPSILLERAATGDQFAFVDLAVWDLGPVSGPEAAGVLLAARGPDGRPPATAPVVDASSSGAGARAITHRFEYGGRRLALVAQTLRGYGPAGVSPAWALLAAGLTTVALLLLYGYLRRRTDRAIETTAARLRGVVDASPDAFLGLDADGRIVTFGARAEALLGRTPAELLGSRLDELISFDDDDADASTEPQWAISLGVGDTPTAGHREGIVRRPAGDTRSVEAITAPGPVKGGWDVTCFVRDVTEQVRAREERARSGRLEALGQLAAGVAHDFRNTLWGIDLVAGGMRTREPSRASLDRDASVISDAVAHGNALAAQLLEFARPRLPTGEAVPPGAIVRSLAPMLEHLVGVQRVLRLSIEDETSLVQIETGQLQAAVINLVTNAHDATGDGGVVDISVRCESVSSAQADALGITPGEVVAITVADSGTGMTAEVRLRLFEPYFTTKAVGKGIGLGLATLYGAVKGAGGAITVESEVGAGSTFRILLPVHEPFDPAAY